AASHNDVWAVGNTVTSVTDSPLIEHWNGSSWSVAQLPSLGGPSELSGVRVVSARNVWAVGYAFDPATNIEQTLILHWDGSSWARVASPNPGPPGAGDALTGIATTSASNAWAVGQATSDSTASPLILRWNGRTWSPAKIPPLGASSGLTGVAATSASNAWAVGQDI